MSHVPPADKSQQGRGATSHEPVSYRMWTGGTEFRSLVAPFTHDSFPDHDDNAAPIWNVKDSRGTVVVDYVPSEEHAKLIAAALNGVGL